MMLIRTDPFPRLRSPRPAGAGTARTGRRVMPMDACGRGSFHRRVLSAGGTIIPLISSVERMCHRARQAPIMDPDRERASSERREGLSRQLFLRRNAGDADRIEGSYGGGVFG